jgi:1,4-alpha-glucan branching enzyme
VAAPPLSRGHLVLVLHAHLPFVRQPDHPRFLEEEWLFEALSESYLPLIETFERLAAEKVPYRVTLSVSPPLAAMLTDELLMQRYVGYLHERLDALDGERRRAARHDPDLMPIIGYYEQRYGALMNRFVHRDSMDVTRALMRLASSGHLELITTAATHGYLPLLWMRQSSVWAQLSTGIAAHEQIFGHRPHGLWLPECGFRPGVEHLLNDLGIAYFFVETHGLLKADPRPK